jgi:hypothetical protein
MNKQERILGLHWQKHLKKLEKGVLIDRIFDEDDPRLCLALLIRLPKKLNSRVALKVQELKLNSKFPRHYYQPTSQLHLTVLGFIPLETELKIDDIFRKKLVNLLNNSLEKYSQFEITLRGVNVAPNSVFIQGFYDKNVLDNIRVDLIARIKKEKLGLDSDYMSSYNLGFAWVNIARYLSRDIANLLREIRKLRNLEFGKFTVKKIELVVTDKYFSRKNTRVIKSFLLRNPNELI